LLKLFFKNYSILNINNLNLGFMNITPTHPTAQNISTSSPSPAAAQGVAGVRCSEVALVVNEIFLRILFAIEYVANSIFQGVPFTQGECFQEKLVCKTDNFAKFSDLREYASRQHNPRKLSDKAQKRLHTAEPIEVIPQPFGGHCLGNATVFVKQWLKDPEIQANVKNPQHGFEKKAILKIAKSFQGGSSLKGAIYQEGYERIREAIIEDKTINKADKGKEIYRATFANAGLSADEEFLRENLHDRPTQILRQLATIDPGAYLINMPTYSPTGNSDNARHAIGLIVSATYCYILDSNNGIGWTNRGEDLSETVGRIFTEYTGYKYSIESYVAADSKTRYRATCITPTFLTQMGNFLKGWATPPNRSIFEKHDFELLKINRPSPEAKV
jgi:hypothetical protein